jgi:hypothetical protein
LAAGSLLIAFQEDSDEDPKQPQRDAAKDHPEQVREDVIVARVLLVAVVVVVRAEAVLLLALVREHEPVLDAAAALQDVWVVGRVVALADDVGGAQLEVRRQRRRAGPVRIVAVVAGAGILAAHDVDLVEASSITADAF